MTILPHLAFILPLLACGIGEPVTNAAESQDKDLAYEVGVDAYVYAYPMLLMEMTRRVSTNVESPIGIRAPTNRFAHAPVSPDHTMRAVVRPNVDTLYSTAWFDVTREPLVLTIPEGTERYHMMPMLDMWTEVFACPGTRTNGPAGGHFAILGPNWRGELPAGVQGIRSPTSLGWILGRTQANGPSDYETVHAIQAGYRLTPLSQFGRRPTALPAAEVDPDFDMETPPPVQVTNLSTEAFYELFAELLANNPPHEVDWPILARLRRIGFVAGETFDFSELDTDVQEALERGAQEARQLVAAHGEKAGIQVNGWSMMLDGMGSYGTAYVHRAYIARIGLGANLVEDAVYPMTMMDDHGQPYDGSRAYRLHFAADALPPVRAFWSLTMYDDEMYLAENPLGRYAIGDRDDLKFNPDGSLDILIQHEPPPEELMSNWLPAPGGTFDLVLRLYWPEREILTRGWLPPAVTRIEPAD